MRLLVIKLEALGDVLRTTALLSPIKARRPDMEIWWLTSKAARPLIESNPMVDRALHWCPRDLAALKTVRFNRVLCMEEDPKCAALRHSVLHGMWTGVCPGGYSADSAPFYDMSLLNAATNGDCSVPDALKRANRFSYEEIWLSIIGLNPETPLTPSLFVSEEEKDKAAALLDGLFSDARGPRFAINPGAGKRWRSKRIPDGLVLEISRAAARKFGAPLLLLGGPEEAREHPALAAASRGNLLYAGAGHSLTQFAAIIRELDGLISTDSLALHTAKAVRTPVVGLFGPTSAAEVKINLGTALRAEECGCFYRSNCNAPEPCLGRIPASLVVNALKSLDAGDRRTRRQCAELAESPASARR